MRLPLCSALLVLIAVLVGSLPAFAQQGSAEEAGQAEATPGPETSATSGGTPASTGSSAAQAAPQPAHVALLKDAEKIDGLLTLYRKNQTVYAELTSGDYSSEFLVLISIAKGIGRGYLLGGMSWGDDWVWQFRKVDDKVHVIRKNVRFKAKKVSPEESALSFAYTDSVLFSLPIAAKGPKGGDLVDLSNIFMTDLPQISMVLPGFSFSSSKSTWDEVKGFKDNVELRVAATYASSGNLDLETVPDSRGVTLGLHYSISKIPSTGYQPRLADDRVGYFLTVVKDYSRDAKDDFFVRYINRWQLEKADPSAEKSPPKKPVVFWLEKTIPFKYRKPIRDGIAEWNKAFYEAGFIDAIEVRQQPDDAAWDPEDVNYNTFRWITSSAGFAIGPSRVNPYSGQILDADILFDSDFLQYWKLQYETLTPESIAAMTGGVIDPDVGLPNPTAELEFPHSPGGVHRYCLLSHGMSRQLAFAHAALLAQEEGKEGVSEDMQEKLIMQGLKEVAMHEVGHTLGLRHNFKASTMLSLEDMNDAEKIKERGMVASVMDYNPTNIVPKGQTQGDFMPTTLGAYDVWAIQYGYTPQSGGTDGEKKELEKIASRSGEPGLQFSTDEDTIGTDPDPHSNRFDLGDDLVAYARRQSELVDQVIPGIVDRMAKEGSDYTDARRAFGVLLSQQGQSLFFAARYVGGLYTSRSHKGDKDAPAPISAVEIERQREALELLEQRLFGPEAFQFPREIYNYLAATNWDHWGQTGRTRKDYPVHDVVAQWQSRVLDQLLSSVNLTRIHDTELKYPPETELLTTADLLERLTSAVFAETESLKEGDYSNREPAISSFRRNLQRIYLRKLSFLALGQTSAPDDCQTIAYAQLSELDGRIQKLLKGKVKLDDYSRAHLQETSARINKVLDARLELPSP